MQTPHSGAPTPQPSRRAVTARQVANHIRRSGGTSIGDTERLADIHTADQRRALWFAHRDAWGLLDTQGTVDIVMADCRRRIARACNTGLLSLWPQQPGGAA